MPFHQESSAERKALFLLALKLPFFPKEPPNPQTYQFDLTSLLSEVSKFYIFLYTIYIYILTLSFRLFLIILVHLVLIFKHPVFYFHIKLEYTILVSFVS